MTLLAFILSELRRKKTPLGQCEKPIGQILDRVLKNRWCVSFRDRGMGHGDFGVSVRLGTSLVLIVGDLPYKELAEHICQVHNAGRRTGKE